MIMELDHRVAEVERMISRMVRIGTVHDVDHVNDRVSVLIGELPTAPLPYVTHKAAGDTVDASKPEVGEQVVVVAPFGDLSQAVVIAALYCDANPSKTDSPDIDRKTYKDGAVIEYNRATHALKATLPAGGTAEVTAPGGIHLVGPVTIDGDVTQNGSQIVNGSSSVSGASTVQGKGVARLGDRVNVAAGSSAGMWPIAEASQ